ncbi:MAG: LicD family protein [Butyrivibrio sp.]|nr:LicD family protein [Butyrivibrio sp.]
MNDTEIMEKIHQCNFELLSEIKRICEKYDIQFFLHGGTLLGSVRHQDFIPWDDDVDIIFLRQDYEKFIRVVAKELPENMEFLDYNNYPQFFDFIAKISNKNLTYKTTYGHEDFYEHRYSHPSVDLFVLDRVGKHHGLQLAIMKILYAFAMGHRKTVDLDKYKGTAKIGAVILPAIGKLIPLKTICKQYRYIATLANPKEDSSGFDITDKVYISNEQQHPHYWGLCYDMTSYQLGTTKTMRGLELQVPSGYDATMSVIYGDYMKLPPESQRVCQHVELE